MNKKGFVLIETIVVIVVVSVALLTLFSSYYKILNKMNSENKYDNPEYLYMTYYVKKELSKMGELQIFNLGLVKDTDNTLINHSDKLSSFVNTFDIKNVYLVKNVNHDYMKNNLKYFNAYVIDYLNGLDVEPNETILIVEYNRLEKDEALLDKLVYCSDSVVDGKYCYDDLDDNLKKTYVASLKW